MAHAGGGRLERRCNVDNAEIFSQLGHIETLRYRDKTYAVTPCTQLMKNFDTGVADPGYAESHHTKGAYFSSFTHQLPVILAEQPDGPGRIIDLLVHEDLEAAAAHGMLKSVILEITVAQFTRDDAFEFKVNGQALPYPESTEFGLHAEYEMGPRWNGMQGNYALRFNLHTGSILRRGNNEIELVLRRRNPKLRSDFVVHDIFLHVAYHHLTMRG